VQSTQTIAKQGDPRCTRNTTHASLSSNFLLAEDVNPSHCCT
jgi:hypothetical protein